MWGSILLTLLATAGNNIGKVFQKKGTLSLPPLSFKLKIIRAYVLNKLWIGGFLMDMSGAGLMLLAISQAPVSIIQPVAGCGLALLSVFSHFYLKEIMNGLDWLGITLAALGTIGVGVGGEEQKVLDISLLRIPWLVFSIVILFVLLNAWLRMYRNQRHDQEQAISEVTEEIIYGLESGILFGISSVISKMGFILSVKGFSTAIPAGISVSVLCSALGFVYQTRGLKHGRAVVVSTCTSVASIVTGVVAGMLVLGEEMPSNLIGRLVLIVGWFFIISGVILLVISNRLIALLPRRFQKLLKANTDRSHSLKKSRNKDPGPGTSVHASTLQSMILPLAAKEKA